jgi:hypothetical protein
MTFGRNTFLTARTVRDSNTEACEGMRKLIVKVRFCALFCVHPFFFSTPAYPRAYVLARA